jgi:hypothetical protein
MHKSFPEIRPIFLRKAERTKAHVLALKITRHFEACLRPVFGTTDASACPMTPDDALVALGRLTYLHQSGAKGMRTLLPRPDELQSSILDALGLSFPRKG